MFGKKIKLDNELYEKATTYASKAGYSSVDEFVVHIIEKEIAKIEQGGQSVEDIENNLRGLGYIS